MTSPFWRAARICRMSPEVPESAASPDSRLRMRSRSSLEYAFVPLQVHEDSRIDGAGARRHHQAFQRRETHGGVDALAVLDRAHRSSASQVANQQAAHLTLSEQLRRAAGSVLVGQTVEAIAADAVLHQPIVGNSIGIGCRRKRRMKGRIEDSDLRDAAPDCAGGCIQNFELAACVEWCDLRASRQSLPDFRGDQRGLAIRIAAVYNAMAYRRPRGLPL